MEDSATKEGFAKKGMSDTENAVVPEKLTCIPGTAHSETFSYVVHQFINSEFVTSNDHNESNFEFDGYRRISFSNLKVTHDGIYEGLCNILSSSILYLKSPSNFSNLSFRTSIPSSSDWDNISSRADFCKLMIPTMSLETICDLSESFVHDDPHSRNVEVKANSNVVIQKFTQFELEFETSLKNAYHCQQKYSNAIWYMHEQGDSSPSALQIKYNENTLKNNCIIVFTKNCTFEIDSNLSFEAQNDAYWNQIVTVKMRSYVCLTDENRRTFETIWNCQKAKITIVGQITQFLKGLKIVSVPDKPENIPVDEDYNLSPAFNAIINPNLFVDLFSAKNNQSFQEKFKELMTSEGLGLLVEDGAPGTGKTTIAVATITDYILAAKEQSQKLPHILVTTPSNSAADVFYLKLRDRLPSISICRIGEKEKFKQEVKEFAENDFKQFLEDMGKSSDAEFTENYLKNEFILSSYIIVVTLGSSQSNELLNLRLRLKFDLLVVDECGQAKLDEILFPLHFTSIHRLLLIGDPRQLGPTLKSSLMMSLPTTITSIFVKLCNYLHQNYPQSIVHLRKQHRMRPLVVSIVNYISYADTKHLTTDLNGNWKRTVDHPSLLVFSGESWFEKRTVNTFSYENRKEAEFGIALLRASLQRQCYDFDSKKFPLGKSLTYAIIALYRGQVNLFNRLITELGLKNTVKVYTVDQMQGSECDIAIVSAVRASADHLTVGFASDLRRLNVALSRAACVYVLAKYDDFKSHQGWSKLFHEATRKNCLYPDADLLLANNYISEILTRHIDDSMSAGIIN